MLVAAVSWKCCPVLRASDICIILRGICERYAPDTYTDGTAIARQQRSDRISGERERDHSLIHWSGRDFEKFNRGDEIMTTRRRVRGESRYRWPAMDASLFFPRERERDMTLRMSQIITYRTRNERVYASRTDVFTFDSGYLIWRSLFYWFFDITVNWWHLSSVAI